MDGIVQETAAPAHCESWDLFEVFKAEHEFSVIKYLSCVK